MFLRKKHFVALLIVISFSFSLLFIFLKNKRRSTYFVNSTLKELRALPYAVYSGRKADKTKKGVVFNNRSKAYDGYNQYWGFLMDMDGHVIFRLRKQGNLLNFLEDGNILFSSNEKIAKCSFSGNLIWSRDLVTHHEIVNTYDNTILLVSTEVYIYKGRKVRFDAIVELSQDGEELSRWSTWSNLKHLSKFHNPSKLEVPEEVNIPLGEKRAEKSKRGKSKLGYYEYYHLNSIQVLPDTELGKIDKRFQKGNWLLCARNTDLVFILDKNTKKVVWSYGPGILDWPHMPRMLDNGNILIYDNGSHREYTRIIEINPVNKKIVWEYKANPPKAFFSHSRGSAQRLPNGNTLIADADNGRAFEVTKVGEIVWEWYNPEFDEKGKRKLIYRMIRYPKEYINNISKISDGK